MSRFSSGPSLRKGLMLGILVPVLAFMLLNAASLYRQALLAADTAYDRTLLASAKAIGEQLEVVGTPGRPAVRATLPYSALEAFEADTRSRMVYKVSGFDLELVSGYPELRTWRGKLPDRNVYAALVHFYDDHFRGEPVRVAVLLQPVAGDAGQGMATIQVAETLELRRGLARELLIQTVWQQAGLLAIVAGVVIWVVQRATRPVRALSAQLQARPEGDLTPLPTAQAPHELQPLLVATNGVMARLNHLLQHQKRFVRDTSHQLRTPLAVLQTQVQSAQRGDVDPSTAFKEIAQTVAGATELANQMLALAKVEQLRQQGHASVTDWTSVIREVALTLSPLVAEKHLDFELHAEQAAPVSGHEWALRELTRNLVHNAVRYSPPGGRLRIRLDVDGRHAALSVADQGPGIPEELRERLFQPFARARDAGPGGTGLGLSICREIVENLGGNIVLENRLLPGQRIDGLDAVVRLPLAPSP